MKCTYHILDASRARIGRIFRACDIKDGEVFEIYSGFSLDNIRRIHCDRIDRRNGNALEYVFLHKYEPSLPDINLWREVNPDFFRLHGPHYAGRIVRTNS